MTVTSETPLLLIGLFFAAPALAAWTVLQLLSTRRLTQSIMTSAAAVLLYYTVVIYSRTEARSCLEALELSTSLDRHQTYLSAVSGSCTCILQSFGAGVEDKTHWIMLLRNRVASQTFLGLTTLKIDVEGKRVLDASVFCANSWEGVFQNMSGSFWTLLPFIVLAGLYL